MTPSRLAVITAVVGALVAGIIALVTFGAQASARPDGVPVAVSVPTDGPAADGLRTAAGMLADHGGGQLDVTVMSPEQARTLLDDKDVYGVLQLDVDAGVPQATVVVSGAVNPAGTQVAQQALTGAGQALLAELSQRDPSVAAGPVGVEQVHPTGPSTRVVPLAVTAVAWLGCLVAGAALTLFAQRSGVRMGMAGRLANAVTTSVLVTGLIVGYVALWDGTLPLGWDVVGLVGLTTLAFALVQGGLLHLAGIKAIALLGPLYLVAPAVVNQVPELLHPAYRVALWSWTPFRFPAEALRSLFAGTPDAPDVALAVWVMAGVLVMGLLLLAVPRRSAGQQAETHPAHGIVDVGVDEADRLPRP
ncbi:MAG: ABC transporter permease [Actinophytocola sp.]|nr:ABC transporter permease [Actinophytocola sp.]